MQPNANDANAPPIGDVAAIPLVSAQLSRIAPTGTYAATLQFKRRARW